MPPIHYVTPSPTVPEEVAAERDRRYEAEARQAPTASWLGDPPDGYSALDTYRPWKPRFNVSGRDELYYDSVGSRGGR